MLDRIRRARLTVNLTGLEFDRGYGVCNRTGWSALVRGSYVAEMTTLCAACRALLLAKMQEARHG